MARATRTHEKVTSAPACFGPDGSADLVRRGLHVIDGRWKLTIIFRLFATPTQRFSELERGIEGISHKMLSAHLRELERDGVVKRTEHGTKPPKIVCYELTPRGLALRPILRGLRLWSTK